MLVSDHAARLARTLSANSLLRLPMFVLFATSFFRTSAFSA